jgi:hypothetical protein
MEIVVLIGSISTGEPHVSEARMITVVLKEALFGFALYSQVFYYFFGLY